MATGNEERLIREILEGAYDRFEEIVRSYQKRIAGLAFRMGVRFDDLEDVTVEVMAKTFRNLHLYRPEYAFSTWIYRLAINHVRDYHRRHRRDRVLDPMPEHLSSGSPDPLASAVDRRRRSDLREALGRLPERYRVPLVLLHLEEKTLEEIGEILNLPTGTVKSRLARGRDRLRRILERDFPHLARGGGES